MRIILTKGDITELECDAVVNAANSSLRRGGGVDGAIHSKAGPELAEACAEIGGCPTGEARLTKGFGLKTPYIIHAVGPVWKDGRCGEDELLKKTYRNALQLASNHKLSHIAFPNISTGIYHFPKELAAHIALETVSNGLQNGLIKDVTFACFDEENFEIYKQLLSKEKASKSFPIAEVMD